MNIINETAVLDNLEEIDLTIKDVNQIVNIPFLIKKDKNDKNVNNDDKTTNEMKEQLDNLRTSKKMINVFARINDKPIRPVGDPS